MTCPAEFRESSVKLALDSEQSIAQTARHLGVNKNTLHAWIKKYTRRDRAVGKNSRTDKHLYDELKRSKKENCRLKDERDLFKKPAAYFAQSNR